MVSALPAFASVARMRLFSVSQSPEQTAEFHIEDGVVRPFRQVGGGEPAAHRVDAARAAGIGEQRRVDARLEGLA